MSFHKNYKNDIMMKISFVFLTQCLYILYINMFFIRKKNDIIKIIMKGKYKYE